MKIFFRQMRSLIMLSLLELWRRKDVFTLLVLSVALMVPLGMAKPFGTSGATRYLDETALVLIWGFSVFICLGTGSRLFPPEFESRTIYPLRARPISAGRLLFGKYLGAVCASWAALSVFYAIFAFSIVIRGGVLTAELAQGFVLHLAFAALTVATALFFSLIISRGATLTLGAILIIGMFLFGRRLPYYSEVCGTWSGPLLKGLYAVAPHVEFFDMRQRMIHGWGTVDATVFAVVLVYAAVYVAALLGISAIIFKRKQL